MEASKDLQALKIKAWWMEAQGRNGWNEAEAHKGMVKEEEDPAKTFPVILSIGKRIKPIFCMTNFLKSTSIFFKNACKVCKERIVNLIFY